MGVTPSFGFVPPLLKNGTKTDIKNASLRAAQDFEVKNKEEK